MHRPLGHLHHTLTQQQLNEIGRIDVVMVPVDGGVTLDLDGMAEVLAGLKAPLMIPMHYFSTYSLRRFLDVLGEKSYEVEMSETPFGRGVQDHAAGEAEAAGAARPRFLKRHFLQRHTRDTCKLWIACVRFQFPCANVRV